MGPSLPIVVLWTTLFMSVQHLVSDRTREGIATSKSLKGLGKAENDFINQNILWRFPALVYFNVFHSMSTGGGPLPATASVEQFTMFQGSLL